MYLESIFIGGDIRAQLPEEAKKFDDIDKTFKKVCDAPACLIIRARRDEKIRVHLKTLQRKSGQLIFITKLENCILVFVRIDTHIFRTRFCLVLFLIRSNSLKIVLFKFSNKQFLCRPNFCTAVLLSRFVVRSIQARLWLLIFSNYCLFEHHLLPL